MDTFYQRFYLLGKGWIFIPVVVSVYAFYPYKLKVFLLGSILQALVVKALKYTIKRKRPASVLDKVYLMEELYLKSFPSGDTAMAFFFAFFFLPLVSVYVKPLLIAYSLLIAYGRVYMGAHYPSDVLVGALIGIGSSLVAHML